MKFKQLKIKGAYLITPEFIKDERGFFARTACAREFKKNGLLSHWPQHSISFNKAKGTLRGMHFQPQPYGEIKLVRCTQGAIFDVLVDLRPRSKTFRRWVGVELSAANRKLIYIPKGVAHGFQTLTPNTEIFYLISEFFRADKARGVRWDDTAVGIHWPKGRRLISKRDRAFEDLT